MRKIIGPSPTAAWVKIPVNENRWAITPKNRFDVITLMRDLDDVVNFPSKARKNCYEDIEDLLDSIPELDIDTRSLEDEFHYEYIVEEPYGNLTRKYSYESLYEAIEHVVGIDIPSRHRYKCTADKSSTLYTSDFAKVVEYFYENYQTFECSDLNSDELEFLDKVKYFIFSSIMTK